jgi:N-acetylneuraminic acid mutarotase
MLFLILNVPTVRDAQATGKVSYGLNTERNQSQFSLQSNEWIEITPILSPSARWGHSMVYDSKNDRTFLFGGGELNLNNNDTWRYDLENNTWVILNARPSPSGRTDHSMAYDMKSNRIILFGGYSLSNNGYPILLNDTWSYDIDKSEWKNITSPVAPSVRAAHSMTYDSESDRIVLFGGGDESKTMNDTWVFDCTNNTWANVTFAETPSDRSSYSMTYDDKSDRVILFGGYHYNRTGIPIYLNDTWSYDLNHNKWKNLTPIKDPSPRFDHAMVYDSVKDQIILFGGSNSMPDDDIWVYNYTKNT